MEMKFAKSHEWVKFIDETTVQVGISEHAQDQLGDIVFVSLHEEGDDVEAGEPFGDIESVKAVSDLLSPVTGVVSKVNEAVEDEAEIINADAENTWLLEISDVTDTSDLMTAEEYAAFIEEA